MKLAIVGKKTFLAGLQCTLTSSCAIKNAKRQSNFDRLGENPSAKTIYRNLKSHRRCNQPAVKLPDLEKN